MIINDFMYILFWHTIKQDYFYPFWLYRSRLSAVIAGLIRNPLSLVKTGGSWAKPEMTENFSRLMVILVQDERGALWGEDVFL